MSVINQMLRDLDARGQGATAARRAAMAAVGEGRSAAHSPWRSSRTWWWVAALIVALAVAVVVWGANRWGAVAALQNPAVAEQVPPDNPAPAIPPPAVTPVITPPVITPAVAMRPAAPPAAETPALPTPAPAPERAPAPARARIERVVPLADPLDAARIALSEGRAAEALSTLPDGPDSSPERDALEAAALQQLGRHTDAERAYRRALAREPDIGAWWAGLGISLDADGRGDEALDAFRQAQRRGPLDPALADYLGERVEALSADELSR